MPDRPISSDHYVLLELFKAQDRIEELEEEVERLTKVVDQQKALVADGLQATREMRALEDQAVASVKNLQVGVSPPAGPKD